MATSGRTQQQINNSVQRPYITWATGDGVKTEFVLAKNVRRLDDLMVTANGAVLRPDKDGTLYDYSVRGVTPGYAGEANTVKIRVAPAAGVNVGLFQSAV